MSEHEAVEQRKLYKLKVNATRYPVFVIILGNSGRLG